LPWPAALFTTFEKSVTFEKSFTCWKVQDKGKEAVKYGVTLVSWQQLTVFGRLSWFQWPNFLSCIVHTVARRSGVHKEYDSVGRLSLFVQIGI
jgi:hypothetical protein